MGVSRELSGRARRVLMWIEQVDLESRYCSTRSVRADRCRLLTESRRNAMLLPARSNDGGDRPSARWKQPTLPHTVCFELAAIQRVLGETIVNSVLVK
jgi:hypothetical protein